MDVYTICPDCSFEFKLKKVQPSYVICPACGNLYNVLGPAKIRGIRVSTEKAQEIYKQIENSVRDVDNVVHGLRGIIEPYGSESNG